MRSNQFAVACVLFVQYAVAGSGKNVYGDYWVDVQLNPKDENYAMFKIQLSKQSWFGLSLGAKNMRKGTDMIAIDGANQKVYDQVSVGEVEPKNDAQDDIEFKFRDVDADNVEVQILRKLDTEDVEDFLIPVDQRFTIGWVVNTASADLAKEHNRDGGMSVTLTSAKKSADNTSADKTPDSKVKNNLADTSNDEHSDHEGQDHSDHENEEDGASELTGFAMTAAAIISVGLL